MLWVAADRFRHSALAFAARRSRREEIARRFAHIPDGTLEYVSDAGHMLHHDQPQAVARAIEKFLA